MIFATFPLLTLLLAAAMRLGRMTLARSMGVLFTIAGVGSVLAEKLAGPAGDHAWLGDAAVFASALTGAICSVLYRPYLRKYPTLPVSAYAMLASVLFLAVLAAHEGFFREIPQFTNAGWAAIAFIGISSGVGYFLWLYALGHAPPTKVTVFLSLSPDGSPRCAVPEPVTARLAAATCPLHRSSRLRNSKKKRGAARSQRYATSDWSENARRTAPARHHEELGSDGIVDRCGLCGGPCSSPRPHRVCAYSRDSIPGADWARFIRRCT